ncbi:hypothetical protein ACFWN2_35050 [Lentzea sp. NPDC058436]|uniref:hypothetical protein n=1 Tax=Lentzea sp. NPDC058436 TaxID=3346499 RepID=UPI00366146E2
MFSGVPIAHTRAAPEKCELSSRLGEKVRFPTSDGFDLPGLVLGGGSRGVLFADFLGADVCGWISLGQQLADDGYQVLLYQGRSTAPTMDADIGAAAQELADRGATSIIAGGVLHAGAAVALRAPRISGLAGVFLLHLPFEPSDGVNVPTRELEAVRKLDVPVFIGADSGGEEQARRFAEAASRDTLAIEPDAPGGVEVIKDGEPMRDKLRAFVLASMPVPAYERWRWPVGGAVALLVLAALGVVVHRRRRGRTA